MLSDREFLTRLAGNLRSNSSLASTPQKIGLTPELAESIATRLEQIAGRSDPRPWPRGPRDEEEKCHDLDSTTNSPSD